MNASTAFFLLASLASPVIGHSDDEQRWMERHAPEVYARMPRNRVQQDKE